MTAAVAAHARRASSAVTFLLHCALLAASHSTITLLCHPPSPPHTLCPQQLPTQHTTHNYKHNTKLQVLEVYVRDSHMTGRTKLGKAMLPLK